MKNSQKQTLSKNPQTGYFLIEVGLHAYNRFGPLPHGAYELVIGRYSEIPDGENPVQVLSDSLPVVVSQFISDTSRVYTSVRFVPFPKSVPSESYLQYRGRNSFHIVQALCISLLNQLI